MRSFNKIPHSPYFIFIRGVENKSDQTILELFGFNQIEPTSNDLVSEDEHCIYLYREKEWVHLMDNFYYTHWHSNQFKARIKELGKQYEIFTCRLKDVDESYDFKYFKHGELKRNYMSESPNYSDVDVTVNFGEKMNGELDVLSIKEDIDYPIVVAKELGIKLAKSKDHILCYKVILKFQAVEVKERKNMLTKFWNNLTTKKTRDNT